MAQAADPTNRKGVHAVGLMLGNLGWIFREQPTSDDGIDAQAEQHDTDGKKGSAS